MQANAAWASEAFDIFLQTKPSANALYDVVSAMRDSQQYSRLAKLPTVLARHGVQLGIDSVRLAARSPPSPRPPWLPHECVCCLP
jgi:hypothetical protein